MRPRGSLLLIVAVLAGCAKAHRPEPPAVPPPPIEGASLLMRAIAGAAIADADADPEAGTAVVTHRNRFDPEALVKSPAIFAAVADEIAGATEEVDLQTYLWERDSDPVKEILDGLSRLDRARAGATDPVTVRILVDSLEIRKPTASLMGGIAADVERLKLDPTRVRVELAAHVHAGAGSLHSKTLVVDGRRAIVQGANPQRAQDFDQPWFDAGFRMEGEVAGALREEFADSWKHAQRWECGTRQAVDPAERCLAANDPIPPLEGIERVAGIESLSPALVIAHRDEGDPLGKARGPVDEAFLAAFRRAQRTIDLQTPNLNEPEVLRALREAVMRGVRVRVVLSKGFHAIGERVPGGGGDNRHALEKLFRVLRHDVPDPCARLQARWFSLDGRTPVTGESAGASHAKFLAVDGQVAFVGSANMDQQSWRRSREVIVVVDDPKIARSWTGAVFEPSFARATRFERCRR